MDHPAADARLFERFVSLREDLSQTIVGQAALVERLLIALLADGHLLVEGAPGLAKTTAIKALAARIEANFHRVQFTPDLLPADLTGTEVYRPQEARFEFQPGPLFHNLLLADEINRAPAKVQSALLEAMGERRITVGRVTYALPDLFLVMATQNPIEQEGTYPLPEAQLDRFLLRLPIGYPSQDEENAILDRFRSADPLADLQPVTSPQEIVGLQQRRREIRVENSVRDYIVRIARATRENQDIQLGASPRASLALDQAAQAWAAIHSRDFVIPDDIKFLAPFILCHRMIISPQAQLRGRTTPELVADIVAAVPVPVEG